MSLRRTTRGPITPREKRMKALAREQVIALDKAYVWHPYTAMDEYIAETNPLVIARASGPRLFDVEVLGFGSQSSALGARARGPGRAAVPYGPRRDHARTRGVAGQATGQARAARPRTRVLQRQRFDLCRSGTEDVAAILGAERAPRAHALRRVRWRVSRRNLGRDRARRGRGVPATVFVRDHGMLARAGGE